MRQRHAAAAAAVTHWQRGWQEVWQKEDDGEVHQYECEVQSDPLEGRRRVMPTLLDCLCGAYNCYTDTYLAFNLRVEHLLRTLRTRVFERK